MQPERIALSDDHDIIGVDYGDSFAIFFVNRTDYRVTALASSLLSPEDLDRDASMLVPAAHLQAVRAWVAAKRARTDLARARI
jgi:hypothetical protein